MLLNLFHKNITLLGWEIKIFEGEQILLTFSVYVYIYIYI